jgi:hypothetical protein
MLVNLGYVDFYLKSHVAELLREVENDRLVDLAIGPGRPIRVRLAEWLYAAAERIEGSPRGSVLRAEG